LSWSTPGQRYRRHLCGLSHGAGGIGWALIELFATTGDERFRKGAEGAFAYERSWLHEASGTWPDLRIGGQRRNARPAPSPVRATWSHGEAGIALTRLRAIGVLGPGAYEEEARIALDTTERHLVAALPYEIDDLTLSHGLSGAADVLLSGGRHDAPRELGHVAVERYATSGWPCGSGGGTTPALFRGTSGIGWWFLRLHQPARLSPLSQPMRLTALPEPA
jgi:lantibiotic biosynthesis protein